MGEYVRPSFDGDVNNYKNIEAKSTRFWNNTRKVYFINGMDNTSKDHVEAAVGLSLLQMCEVIGVFNKTNGFFPDIGQCLMDKLQYSDPALRSLRKELLKLYSKDAAERIIIKELSRNTAAVSLFKELRKSRGDTEIFAHSQGNLILSNVLTAMTILDGSNALARFTVHSFGSPTVTWPDGFTHHRNGYTFDPINWLAGFDRTFTISKVGFSVSHGFKQYRQDDAEFFVNRFRWGSFGLTASMDEEGIASALVKIGTNIPRITKIFQRLDKRHNSDIDDIALLYINKIKNRPGILNLVKGDIVLRELLTRSMDQGWTTSGESDAIDLLNS